MINRDVMDVNEVIKTHTRGAQPRARRQIVVGAHHLVRCRRNLWLAVRRGSQVVPELNLAVEIKNMRTHALI